MGDRRFRTEPCSAESMAMIVRGWQPRRRGEREISPGFWFSRPDYDKRAITRGQRLLLHWWRRGIEEKVMHENAPYVCPGCHAVGGEECAPDCIDAEIARELEEPSLSVDPDEEDEDSE